MLNFNALTFSDLGKLNFLVFVPCLLIITGIFRIFIVRRFVDSIKRESIAPPRINFRRWWIKSGCLALVLCLSIIAWAKPVQKEATKSCNYLFALDITQSMWVQDYVYHNRQVSRLDMAKRHLLALLDELPAGSRVGLSVFCTYYIESAINIIPPVDVKEFYFELKSIINSIDHYWVWHEGSSLQTSIKTLHTLVKENAERYGENLAVIFLTDGETTMGSRLYLERKDLTVFKKLFFAGYGTIEGGPVLKYDEHGNIIGQRTSRHGFQPVFSKLDENYLKTISARLDGEYKRIEGGPGELNFLAHKDDFMLIDHQALRDVSWLFWLLSFFVIIFFVLI